MDHSHREMTLPEIALIATTRAVLGIGIGLLLAQRLSEARRSAAGWALLLVGIVTTVPLAFDVFGSPNTQSKGT